jgi:hypothetical protein
VPIIATPTPLHPYPCPCRSTSSPLPRPSPPALPQAYLFPTPLPRSALNSLLLLLLDCRTGYDCEFIGGLRFISDGCRTGKGGSILGFVYRVSPFFLRNISLNALLPRQRECMNKPRGPENGREGAERVCKHSHPLQNLFLRISLLFFTPFPHSVHPPNSQRP